ncbi:MAG TPA: tyrosine--tRNA ligase [Acidimicrobiia bacterium]|nr:tyrosine--tRNA ligase [Acidimicrobiia bacterium]
MPDPAEQLNRLLLNIDRVAPEEELAGRLAEGRPLRVKLGLDPTAPSVTLGWGVVLRKLRYFQELGHTAVLIVGDFTAQVGDPSLMAETRRRLTAEEVQGYAEAVLGGFSRVLLPEPLEIRWNSEWLASMDMEHVLELASATTVAQMLERADFAERMAEQRAISVLEFLYPLLQGYDSVAVEADVELGGSDQLWNLLMGRAVQQRYGMRPQVAITMPLLLGTDGVNKMSQSLDNYVAVDDAPADMFGKVMSIPDDLMPKWYRLATELPEAEVSTIVAGLEDGSLHPGEAKRRLGREIVSLYLGKDASAEAEAAFDLVFRDREAPENVPEHSLPENDTIHLPGVLRQAGLVASTSEARRLIAQGAVRIDGSPVSSDDLPRSELVGALIQVGKRRFVRLV